MISPDRNTHGLVLLGEDGAKTMPIDVAFPVMHGKNGEDGTIQGPVSYTHLSRNAQMHGTLIFAKSKEKGKFTSREITLLKQLSHHVNLAVLNARIFQEIQTRQLMLQSTMDFSETGTALSNLNDTIYYMNSAFCLLYTSRCV